MSEVIESQQLEARTWQDRVMSAGERVGATLLTSAALFGATESAAAQTIQSPAAAALKQEYDTFVGQFPGAVIKVEFDNYIDSSVIEKCGKFGVFGQIETSLVPGKRDKAQATLARHSGTYSREVAIEDPNPNVRGDEVRHNFTVDCREVYSTDNLKLEVWQRTNKKHAKKTSDMWKKSPIAGSVKFPEWQQPSAVRNRASVDPAVNTKLTQEDTVELKFRKPLTKKQIKSKEFFLALVSDEDDLLGAPHHDRTVTIIGNITEKKRTKDAGSKWFGKGGAVVDFQAPGYPKYN